MSGPLRWWANRKSRIGLSPAAIRPPHLPGREWWTDPPTAPPEPEHIEFAVRYLLELRRHGSPERNALESHVSAWLRAARQLLHERVESDHGDLHTTDGLTIAAAHLVQRLVCRCVTAGLLSGGALSEAEKIRDALRARAARAKRERAGVP